MKTNLIDTILDDREIESESANLSYLNLVTDNLRSNNQKITRNSFWMVLSVLLYVLILNDEPSLKKVSILFVTIENNILLLNLIPVFFSFIFFQNVTLWNNNTNLYSLFEKITKKSFNLGLTSDTQNVIKPFSLTHHVVNYQFNNKKILKFFKAPTAIILLIVMFFPILFIIFSVYTISSQNTPSVIPITSGILTSIIGISSILQALSTYRD